MGRGIHGIPKVSPGPAMPDNYTPCGQATPQTAYGSIYNSNSENFDFFSMILKFDFFCTNFAQDWITDS
jgi:hypothetical protein